MANAVKWGLVGASDCYNQFISCHENPSKGPYSFKLKNLDIVVKAAMKRGVRSANTVAFLSASAFELLQTSEGRLLFSLIYGTNPKVLYSISDLDLYNAIHSKVLSYDENIDAIAEVITVFDSQ